MFILGLIFLDIPAHSARTYFYDCADDDGPAECIDLTAVDTELRRRISTRYGATAQPCAVSFVSNVDRLVGYSLAGGACQLVDGAVLNGLPIGQFDYENGAITEVVTIHGNRQPHANNGNLAGPGPHTATCQAVSDPCDHPSPCLQAYCRAKRSCESLFGGGGGGGISNQNVIQLAGLAMMIQQSMRQNQETAEACRSQRNASAIMAALSGSYLVACSSARSNCVTSCEAEEDELRQASGANCQSLKREVRSSRQTCEDYEEQQQQAQQQTLQGAMGTAMAQACANQAEQQQDAMAQFCAQNPTLTECGGDGSIDCNNPRNARLLECLCRDPDQQRTNPACNPNNIASGTQARDGFTAAAPYGDPFANMGNVGSLDTMLGLQDPEAGGNFENNPAAGGSNSMNGNRGAGPQQGNGNSGAAPGARAAAAATGPAAPDLGLSGGGGGSPDFAGGGARGAGNNTRGEARELASPDMAKLLAGMVPQKRELAGMTLPAQDGITGPMGPSIWEKISGAYLRVGPRMLP